MLAFSLSKTLISSHRQFQLQVEFHSSESSLVIFGPSGAGKSLLLRLLAGLETPDSGYIRLANRLMFSHNEKINIKPQRRNVAFLFQDYALFPHLTVRQNIAFGLRTGLFNPAEDILHQEVDFWLEKFSIAELENQYPDQLSGGQRQRVALARALVLKPDALLLDEPFSALDGLLRRKMREELLALQQSLHVPLIMISHDPDDLDYFGRDVLRLKNGALDAT